MHEEHDAEDQVWAEQQGLEELAEEMAEGEVVYPEEVQEIVVSRLTLQQLSNIFNAIQAGKLVNIPNPHYESQLEKGLVDRTLENLQSANTTEAPDLREVFRGVFLLLFAITGEKPKAIDSPLGLIYCYAPRLGKDETDKLFRQVVEAIRDLGYMEDLGMVE